MRFWSSRETKSGIRNHIHPRESEERCGSKEEAVVGINFGEAVFGGTGEVEGVRGADVGGGGSGGEHGFEAGHNGFREREESDDLAPDIVLHLVADFLDDFFLKGLFPAFA